ncbi:hypothetical protein GGTG_00175 [Gaeumannomyces tritici R3-111a-1]|uniref:Uncharacterized protein n=1 Tax=Gaeumannomyces tritici (strain R3-111a-1) TaxID=644352 RepID=J3NFY2_GAET3|nr:hypothetical protein GGTG_00175 [Gaeumannomyces tritici R3-111a-1]EJT80172.1 hypothetical protein GGTG_00175 [Gaeumannomyces tritici R3-111a-1]
MSLLEHCSQPQRLKYAVRASSSHPLSPRPEWLLPDACAILATAQQMAPPGGTLIVDGAEPTPDCLEYEMYPGRARPQHSGRQGAWLAPAFHRERGARGNLSYRAGI